MPRQVTKDQGQAKIDEALAVLHAFGLPRGQQNERSALTLLALIDLKPSGRWANLRRPLIGITPIMQFCQENYGKEYAPNTRETFRRYTMHQFVETGLAVANPDNPGRPVNSPAYCYQVSENAKDTMQAYGTDWWDDALKEYLQSHGALAELWAQRREMEMIPVQVAKDTEIVLTPGDHSRLIEQVIAEFAPRFAPGSTLIYVGDTGDKVGYFLFELLADLGVTVDEHGKMPDVVLYLPDPEWLLLV